MKSLITSAFLLLALLLPATAATAYDFEVDGIYYKIIGDEVAVTCENVETDHGGIPYYFSDYSGNVDIPSTVTHEGVTYPVTHIASYAFSGCYELTGITIPNTVIDLGRFSFRDCSSLTTLSMGNSVTSIGYGAFQNCNSLTSVTVPNSVTSIDSEAFSQCTSLADVTIGNSVSYIGYDAFFDTQWFNNQPEGLVYAGLVAYRYKGTMPDGTGITIKDGTLGIAALAFSNCRGMTSISIPNTVPHR